MRIGIIILFFAATVASFNYGCSPILNPYSSDFTCPKTANGKCVDMEAAHEESLAKTGKKSKETGKPPCNGKDCESKNKTDKEKDHINKDNVPTPEIVYQDELHKKLAGLLAQPTTPVVAPPSVMRVLMLPYKGDENELFMLRYVYIIVDGPKWVMGDYLFKEKDGK